MEVTESRGASRWRAALIVTVIALSLTVCAYVGPPAATQVLWLVADEVAVSDGAMPADAHVYTEPAVDWSEFPMHLYVVGYWETCDRPDDFLVGYYRVDLVAFEAVDSYFEDWTDEPEPEPVVWTELVSVDSSGCAVFSGAVTQVATETGGSLPRLTVHLDGDMSREIVVVVPWDTIVTTVSGAPVDCAKYLTSLEASLPATATIEVQSTGGEPWTTRIEVPE